MSTRQRNFDPTRWSLVSRAQRRGDNRSAQEALNALCQVYWYPLYAFARSSGTTAAEAADVTQDFFAWFLEKGYLDRADPARGRLRSFLLQYLKNFMRNEARKERADKRSGSSVHISIDHDVAEARLQSSDDLSSDTNLDLLFDRRWAESVFESGAAAVRRSFEAKGQTDRFTALRPFLSADGEQSGYHAAAERLHVSESSVRGMVHRLRQKFRDALYNEVRETMDDPSHDEVEQELAYLIKVLSSEQ